MASYNHTQTSASTTWVVYHNLNINLNKSSVTCDAYVYENGLLEKILPLDVQFTNKNVVTLLFSSTRTGNARIVG